MDHQGSPRIQFLKAIRHTQGKGNIRKSLSKYKETSTYQTRKSLRFKKEVEWIPQEKKSKKMEDLGGIIKTVIVKVTRSCPTLCDPVGYTVHGILQARTLEWGAFPFSRGSSQPRDWTHVSRIAGRFFTSWATRAPLPKSKKKCNHKHQRK